MLYEVAFISDHTGNAVMERFHTYKQALAYLEGLRIPHGYTVSIRRV